MSLIQDLAESVANIYDPLLGFIPTSELARSIAGQFRGECLQVRVPGIPFGEELARAGDWWAEQATGFLKPFTDPIRNEHERVTSDFQDFLGIPNVEPFEADTRPRFEGFSGPPDEGFVVEVPGWQDVFTFNNEFVFDEGFRRERTLDYSDALLRSPTPPSFREVGEILTTLDDLQDEAATLATVLGVVERVAGRAIPGVGAVALAADALDILGAIGRPALGAGLPGRSGKRSVVDKLRASPQSYSGRIQEARRFRELEQRARGDLGPRLPQTGAPRGDFRIGVGDVLQGLQATDSIFGTGIQLGGIMGFLQDSFWGLVRGATFQAAGPIWDPLGFTEAGRNACYRSPSLDELGGRVYYTLAQTALKLWSDAARVFPYVDVLGEQALASGLVGMRLAENVLGPWLRKGEWVPMLGQMLQADSRVMGGSEAVGTRNLRAGEFVARTYGGTVAATNRAIRAVPDIDRQAFYSSLATSIGWGLMGSMEPAGIWKDLQPVGPGRDAFFLAEANLVPRFDLGD